MRKYFDDMTRDIRWESCKMVWARFFFFFIMCYVLVTLSSLSLCFSRSLCLFPVLWCSVAFLRSLQIVACFMRFINQQSSFSRHKYFIKNIENSVFALTSRICFSVPLRFFFLWCVVVGTLGSTDTIKWVLNEITNFTVRYHKELLVRCIFTRIKWRKKK